MGGLAATRRGQVTATTKRAASADYVSEFSSMAFSFCVFEVVAPLGSLFPFLRVFTRCCANGHIMASDASGEKEDTFSMLCLKLMHAYPFVCTSANEDEVRVNEVFYKIIACIERGFGVVAYGVPLLDRLRQARLRFARSLHTSAPALGPYNAVPKASGDTRRNILLRRIVIACILTLRQLMAYLDRGYGSSTRLRHGIYSGNFNACVRWRVRCTASIFLIRL